MGREALIATAQKIEPVSKKSEVEYAAKREKMVASINAKIVLLPNIAELVGEKNIHIMTDNHFNHVKFIHALLVHYQPELFVDTVLWVFRAYRSRGFQKAYWSVQLHAWLTILKHELSESSFNEIVPLYNWMIENTDNFIVISDIQLAEDINSL